MEAAAEELRRRLGGTLNAKWVSQANMHLTVRFIGHVPDERVPATLDALRPPLTLEPFDLVLSHCGVFPTHGPPRVLWMGVTEGQSSLRAMHDEFNRRLLPLGFQQESRAFNAHLTLARVKDPPRGAAASVREALRALRIAPVRCRISDAAVFESRLSPSGSIYGVQLRVPLRSSL